MSSEDFDELSRRVFFISLASAALGVAFMLGVVTYRGDLPPIPQLRFLYNSITSVSDDVQRDPRSYHLQPSRGQGSGVVTNETPEDGSLVFMAGFFDEQNQIRLVRRDGTVERKWALDYFEHFPDGETRVCDVIFPLRVDTHGAHITPRGEVIFNYEYCGTVKLDQCGAQMWQISLPTHHSLVPAEAGGYWILGRETWLASQYPDRFPPFSTPGTEELMLEDTILRVTEEGEILEEFSIPELMRQNGLEALLTATGDSFGLKKVGRKELVHANKVTELSSAVADAYPMFAAGDLAISMRELNLVMIIDPVTKKVKWNQTGPWLRQHDPEFRPDGKLSIFNNNVYRAAYVNEQTVLSTPFTTNIMTIDPVTRETEVVFGERPGQEMLSVIRGQHELRENGNIVIIEFDAGRVLEVDPEGRIVWEYVNEYDDNFVGEITNAAVVPADYFQDEWKSCEP